jgi:hypothetical protein
MRYVIIASLFCAGIFCPVPTHHYRNYVEIHHAGNCRTYWYYVHCGASR